MREAVEIETNPARPTFRQKKKKNESKKKAPVKQREPSRFDLEMFPGLGTKVAAPQGALRDLSLLGVQELDMSPTGSRPVDKGWLSWMADLAVSLSHWGTMSSSQPGATLSVLCWVPSILPCPPRLAHSMTVRKLPGQTSKNLVCMPTVGQRAKDLLALPTFKPMSTTSLFLS